MRTVKKLALALAVLVIIALLGSYSLSIGEYSVLGLYKTRYEGNVTGFRVEGYGIPLFISLNNDEYKVRVVMETCDNTTASIEDLPAGTFVYTDVLEFSIWKFDAESIFELHDDHIVITVTNGEETITVDIDNGTGKEEFINGVNFYDDFTLRVNGSIVYSISHVPLTLDFIKGGFDKGGHRYVSLMLRYRLNDDWSYKFFLFELPGMWNLTIARQGYTMNNQYTPTWLPDLKVTQLSENTTTYVKYYKGEKVCSAHYVWGGCASWGMQWTLLYNETTLDPKPIIYNGSTVYIDLADTKIILFDNISVTSIYANQPILLNITNGETENTTTYRNHGSNFTVEVVTEKAEKMSDGRYHFRFRIYLPPTSTAVLRLYTRGEIIVEGYGKYKDIAEVMINATNTTYASQHICRNSLIPIAYAEDNSVPLDVYTESNNLNISIKKIITDTGEYIIDSLITVKAKAIENIQHLRYKILLIALGAIVLIILVLRLRR